MQTAFIVAGVLIGAGALVCVVWWLVSRGQKKQMAFVKSRPLLRDARALGPGPVQVEARAALDRPLRSPLSGQPCLAWRLCLGIVEDVGADSPSGHLVTVRSPGCLAPFHVKLGGERVRVAGDPHWIVPTSTLQGSQMARMTGRPDELPDHIRGLVLSCISVGSPHVSTDERIIVDEFIIRPDVTVFVVGAARKQDPEPQEPRRAATSWHVDDQKKIVPVEYKLPPQFPLLIEMTGDTESAPGPCAWTIGPGENRPLLVVEGTRQKLLADMARYKRGLHVDFPLD
jgi:hypothetical protein